MKYGRIVGHGKDYLTAHQYTWDLPLHGNPRKIDIKYQHKQVRSPFLVNQAIKHSLVNDIALWYDKVEPLIYIKSLNKECSLLF
ncbi:MAG: hypothetical protein ACI87J_001022 [Colwellia sp.]